MEGLPWRDVTYCKYGFPYKKQTRLWGQFPFALRPICGPDAPCENVEGRRHPARAQREHRGVRRTLEQLYAIPPQLCDEIAAIATAWVQ